MDSAGLQLKDENPTYLQAEKNLEESLGKKAVTTTDGNAVTLAGNVKIQGIVRNSSFVQRVLDGPNGDSCERLDFAVTPLTDLRAVNQGQLRVKINEMVKEAFDAVTLPNGKKLSESGFDFSGKVGKEAEDWKPYKEQIADARKLVEEGLAEAQGTIPPEVASILLKAKNLDTTPATDGGGGLISLFSGGETSVKHGHVELNLSITSKGEGAKTNSAVVQDNINDRKEELLAAIRESAAATFAASGSKPEEVEKFKADLANLDLKTELTDSGLKLRFGNKTEVQGKPDEAPVVGKTVLAELNEKNLEKIINDTLLFKGKGAGDVAHLIAQDEDVRRLVTEYQDKSPKFAEALKNEILMNSLSSEAYEKAREDKKAAQLIKPDVSIDTSFSNGVQHNELHVAIDLPKGIMQKDVIAGLAGKALFKESVGEMTQKLNEGRAAVANEGLSQGAA